MSDAIDDLADRIVRHLAHYRGQKFTCTQLASALAVDPKDERFDAAVTALDQQGLIQLDSRKRIQLPPPGREIKGVYKQNAKGFGFVRPEILTDSGDVFIPPGKQMSAITGDTVSVRVLNRGKRQGRTIYEGRVTRIESRGHDKFVGRLRSRRDRWYVIPDGKRLHDPIEIPDRVPGTPDNAQVVVQLIEYPQDDRPAVGVIVQVLGTPGDPDVDTMSIIAQHNLPHDMPDACMDEASALTKAFNPTQLDNRDDLTDLVTVTIDPDTARDFDDAITLTRDDDEWELGVHIADVSHFVTESSSLDDEAKRRGNSVYFPGMVVPMLPEVLSNGICSLQEGKRRFTKSVFIRYNADGDVIGQRFCNGVISSNKRLTYQEATSILAGRCGGFSKPVVSLITGMDQLARIIQKRRLQNGMLTLDLPTAELVLDDRGHVVDVQPEDQSFSHTIIEMFMVEANEAVSRLLTHLQAPHLRRIHPEPDSHSYTAILAMMGHASKRGGAVLSALELQHILNSVKGKPEAYSVNLAVLKSLKTAEYAPTMIGHFALASTHYCHFTSPIRRYPDLTVHRLLQRHLSGELESESDRAELPDRDSLTELGASCSYTERRAEDAERELRTVKILRFLSHQLGSTHDGIITGVTEYGAFVQLKRYLAEGLIPTHDLPDGWWELQADTGSLVAQKTGRRLSIGDTLRVKIAAIDVPARELDLALIEQLTTRGRAQRSKPKKKKSHQKRGKRRSKSSQQSRKRGGRRR